MRARRILIVEDEAVVQLHLRRIVESLGYQVTEVAASGEEALRSASENPPDLALMDIRLHGETDGVAVARQLRELGDPAIVFLTAYADEETVARTEQVGAMGYIVKPYSSNEVRAVLATALVLRERVRERLGRSAGGAGGGGTQPAEPTLEGEGAHGMLGRSRVIEDVFERIGQVAPIDWPVLVEGETGTGKELAARAIHAASPRADGPFVTVNCAGLTETLLGSLLFGHRRGSFTGAVEDQSGFFEAADGGVLFLDEIADVSAGVQKALLRVLEDGMVQRIGETRSRPVNVRIISATQGDLAAEVEAGRFRADLLFRLRAVRVSLPPLRERGDDVLLLAGAFLGQVARVLDRPPLRLGEEAKARIRAHAWPGNVRELRNAIQHAALSCRGQVIAAADLPPEVAATRWTIPPSSPVGDERQRILDALVRTGGNRTRAADLLGISRATLYRRFQEHGIDPS